MRRTTFRAAGACALIFALTACAGGDSDDSPEELQENLTEELTDLDLGLTAEQADCFAGLLIEHVGAEELQDIDFTDEEPPAEIAEQFADAAAEAIDACEIDPASVG